MMYLKTMEMERLSDIVLLSARFERKASPIIQLKDGSTNAAIRRKRRLSEDNERAVAEMFDTKADSDT